MKALVISDSEYKTKLFEDIQKQVRQMLAHKGFDVEEISIARGELAHCIGCFGCWVKTPGECVIRDGIVGINRASMHSDAVFYLMPVVFGQFSANMANVVNRWLPNMLPFFMVRKDGSTMHPPRYNDYPANVMIGYGDAVSEADDQLFTDIHTRHRSNVTAFVYRPGMDLARRLDGIHLARTGGEL